MDDAKHKSPLDQYRHIEPGPLAIGPDGGIIPGLMRPPPAAPMATAATFVCLRGPCRHYWELTTHVESGNPAGTFGPDGLKDPATGRPLAAPRQINRACLVHPGTETELTDDSVYACNMWEPMSPRDLRIRLKARERFYKQNPELRGGDHGTR
jgi:hypothetical protein